MINSKGDFLYGRILWILEVVLLNLNISLNVVTVSDAIIHEGVTEAYLGPCQTSIRKHLGECKSIYVIIPTFSLYILISALCFFKFLFLLI